MDDVLALFDGLPRQTFAPGEVLLAEGTPAGAMYVLVDGRAEVRKGGMAVTLVTERGSFLGEMAILLDEPHSADVVALDATEVVVLEDAATAIATSPELTAAIARLLARRLAAVTNYLGDLKRQYADAEGHLTMMDQVLSELMTVRPTAVEPGSERGDQPEY